MYKTLTHSPSHRDAARIVKTITEAVKYLHDQGIVHRGMSLACDADLHAL